MFMVAKKGHKKIHTKGKSGKYINSYKKHLEIWPLCQKPVSKHTNFSAIWNLWRKAYSIECDYFRKIKPVEYSISSKSLDEMHLMWKTM